MITNGSTKAFELGRQDQINERQREHEGEIDAAGGIAKLAGLAGKIVLHGGRQRTLGSFLHEVDRILDRIAGAEIGVDARSAQFVEVVQAARRDRLANAEQVGKLDHFIVAAAHIDVGNVVRIRAIDIRHLDDHVVLFAILLETRDLAAAQHGFKRSADRFDVGADVGDLVAVDCNFELGFVEAQV